MKQSFLNSLKDLSVVKARQQCELHGYKCVTKSFINWPVVQGEGEKNTVVLWVYNLIGFVMYALPGDLTDLENE